MASVDNRVVRMEFDNAQFQAKIKQTMDSLSQLDKALKLDGAHKGLTDVSAAAEKVNLNPLQTAVQSVSTGFLTMSTIAITALSRITNAAITAGKTLLGSFTFEPITDGFKEFETNVGSIQTILANTMADHTSLDDVNKALNQLNDYSDKTIYNFGQMARNIGTFTAAGVDLQTSVDSIKGISNLAAISGSSADQAATAMYQLSQAVSTGTLRLMDWNSVVNAGMGGEVFQKALFDTGKALGTITDVPINTTFEEWTSAGHSFRDSLQEGWLTSEVLTTTLKGFTGEMTEAQLLAIGYTKEQAASILELGRTGVEAATKIRTLSQLLNTVKETIGSGWSRTFQLVIGDFNESSDLFTNINNAISNFVNKQADARNQLLQGWKDMGGRTALIQGLSNAFHALADIIKPISNAFKDVFPPLTAQRLFDITKSFAAFTESLKPSQTTIENIGRIFKGLFSILDVGWEVVKQGAIFLKNLVLQVTGLGSGKILEFTADISDLFTKLRDGLDQGAAIKRFFDDLTERLQKPIEFIRNLKENIVDFFGSLSGNDVVETAGIGVSRFGQRLETVSAAFDRVKSAGERFGDFLRGVMNVLENVGQAIKDWLADLGQDLADSIGPGEFDAVLDALNVSLLGGIALLISKFLSGGINLDFGHGILGNLSETFDKLTGVLSAMQTRIKAQALLKIAEAVGILAASVLVLSLIDSEALTKALTAMAVGFGQLMASFALLNHMTSDLQSAGSFTLVATGMILLSTAILILSGAVALLAQLSWGDLVRGLAGVSVLLAVVTASAIILSKNAGSLILAAVGLTAMAVAIGLLVGPVMLLSTMSWEELAKGLASVAGLLVLLVGSALILSGVAPAMSLAAAGMVAMAGAIAILSGVVAALGQLSWEELGKGLAAVAGLFVLLVASALILSGVAPTMALAAVGLLAMAVAIDILAGAVALLGQLSWTEIAKGLATIAGVLLLLVVATNAMTGALPGAAAILIVSGAMAILGKTLIELSKVKFGDILKALGGLALALLIFGVAGALLEPVIPALLGLGVALLLVGASFALFGVGALAVAKAFEILAKAGPDAAKAIIAAIEAIGKSLPALATGFAEGLLEFIQVFADAAPVIAKALGILVSHILDTLIEILPKVQEVVIQLIDMIVNVTIMKSPDIIQAGLTLLLNLLKGIKDNIQEITQTVLDIINVFLFTLAINIQQIIDAGTFVLMKFISGISDQLQLVTNAVGDLIVRFINAVGSKAVDIANAGGNAIVNFINGVGANVGRVITSGVNVIISFIQGIGSNGVRLANAAAQVLIDFLNDLADVIRRRTPEIRAAGANIASAIADGITGGLASKAGSVANSAIDMAKGALNGVKNFLGIHSPSKEFMEIGQFMVEGMAVGLSDTTVVDDSARNLANSAVSSLRTVISTISQEIGSIEDFQPTITPVVDMTGVQADISSIRSAIAQPINFVPVRGVSVASAIARTATPTQNAIDGTEVPNKAVGGVHFNQVINAPEQLSAADIYKQTRNQITMAKEELNIP